MSETDAPGPGARALLAAGRRVEHFETSVRKDGTRIPGVRDAVAILTALQLMRLRAGNELTRERTVIEWCEPDNQAAGAGSCYRKAAVAAWMAAASARTRAA